ncbi:MAG: hypothetical protein JWP87_3077 [Labilithrix sp.]|jgi:hypothetical protein|nr:hypothetical protein [Labilithrix sp.]
MKLFKSLSLLAVGLGAAGMIASQGCGSSDSGSSSGGTGGGAAVGQPPSKPEAPAAAGGEAKTFAINELFLGEKDRAHAPVKDAWKAYGYNIDKLVTDDKSTDVCQRQAGGTGARQLDGNNGIDNAFGHTILTFITGLLAEPSKSLTDAIAGGSFTVLLTVNGLTDDAAQTNTGLSGQIQVGGSFPAGTKPDFGNPALDWPYRSDVQPVQLSDAFITNGTFVNGSGGAEIGLSLVLQGQTLSLNIHNAIVTFDHKSPNDLTNGTIAGVITTTELVSGIEKVAGSFNVCDGNLLDTLKTTIIGASDILHDGTNKPGVPCDAISIGLGFTAKRVGAPKTPAGPDTATPKDNCKDGGAGDGGDGG